MKCSNFEQLIALDVCGDLQGSERVRVEAHLEGCTACRALADDLRESQSMFNALRQGAVNSSALADVRQRVLNEVGDLEPAPAWAIAMHRLLFAGLRRKTAIAGVALGIVALSVVWNARTPKPSAPLPHAEPVQVARVEPIVTEIDVPRSATVTHSAPRRLKVAKPPVTSVPSKEPQQIMIKLLTDNPDLTIYWLIDEKGD